MTRIPYIVRRLVGLALLAVMIGAQPAVSAEFTDQQREEIGTVIRDYLLQNPEVLREAFEELQRREQMAQADQQQSVIKTNADSLFRSASDLVVGNPEGSVTMVEYFDYNCGYCKRAMPDVLKLLDEDKDLKVVMKEFPILGEGSTFAARAALASRKQGKYWEFHLALMGHRGSVNEASTLRIAEKIGLDLTQLKEDMKSEEIDGVIRGNMATAQALNINGTPAFIIDDKVLPGAVGYSALAGVINQVRDSGGCKIC